MPVLSKPSSIQSFKKRMLEPPILLTRPDKKELQKGQYLSFKLYNDPANANSTTYELSVPYFETGTPEELIDFVIDTERVITGQNIIMGPGKYGLMHRLLKGDALVAFN